MNEKEPTATPNVVFNITNFICLAQYLLETTHVATQHYVHPNFHNVTFHSATPSLIALLVVTFPSYISWVSTFK
jgi:hypothetical protein